MTTLSFGMEHFALPNLGWADNENACYITQQCRGDTCWLRWLTEYIIFKTAYSSIWQKVFSTAKHHQGTTDTGLSTANTAADGLRARRPKHDDPHPTHKMPFLLSTLQRLSAGYSADYRHTVIFDCTFFRTFSPACGLSFNIIPCFWHPTLFPHTRVNEQ